MNQFKVAISIIMLMLLCIQFSWTQNNAVYWSTFSSSFAVLSSSNLSIKSIVGQEFVGISKHSNVQITSGFLVDTLLRGMVVAVRESEQLPTTFCLYQNYPNPFNPSTIINYQLPNDSWVTLKVFDMLGREVAVLVNEMKNAGTYNIEFNASKFEHSSGVYFYRLTAGKFSDMKKMVLLK